MLYLYNTHAVEVTVATVRQEAKGCDLDLVDQSIAICRGRGSLLLEVLLLSLLPELGVDSDELEL